MYLLDTNVCIRLLTNRSARLRARLRTYDPAVIVLCAVTKAELLHGAYHSAHPADNLRILQQFFAPFVSVPFDNSAADFYGRIRADLSRQGKMIGGNDLLIASIAVARELVLVTANTREVERVTGLGYENWELP